MCNKNLLLIVLACSLAACQTTPEVTETDTPEETYELLGYATEIAWGEHLVHIMGCDDCHSPKKMTDMGPVPDAALRLSGHRAGATPPDLDRKVIEKNGYGACGPDMTAWVGPWGISYAGNITSHETGIGNWTKEQFSNAIRKGMFKGLEEGRQLLPPMPWQGYAYMTDDEVSAIFAYLKTVPAVDNVVPAATPPVSAPMAGK